MIFFDRGGDDGGGGTIELHSEYVDAAFRAVLTRNRMDGHEKAVILRDPCHPCPITKTDDGTAYFCGDGFELAPRGANGLPAVKKAHIGVRRDRDFLSGNGGRYPNACLTLASDDGYILRDRILVQFMSQEWSKSKSAMEIGLLTRYPQDLVVSSFNSSKNYARFVNVLRKPGELAASIDYIAQQCGVVWTFSHRNVSKHRTRVCERFHEFLQKRQHYTNLTYGSADPLLRTPFPFYLYSLIRNEFFYFPTGTAVNSTDWLKRQKLTNLKPRAYDCPDRRGLDPAEYLMSRSVNKRTDEKTANDIARSLLPVCFVDDGRGGRRPDINCKQYNPTGCVMFYNDNQVSYHDQLWYPRDMNMSRYCDERSSGVTTNDDE